MNMLVVVVPLMLYYTRNHTLATDDACVHFALGI
jgi:hypothetical protein